MNTLRLRFATAVAAFLFSSPALPAADGPALPIAAGPFQPTMESLTGYRCPDWFRDVVGDWQKAARKQGLRFGVSEHLGASFTWWQDSHKADKDGPFAGVPYDGADPNYADLCHFPADPNDKGWYSTNPRWQRMWFDRIQELVDNYRPNLLYTDGGIPFGETGRGLVAHFYNSNLKRHGRIEAVFACKKIGSGEFVAGTCVQDRERGVLGGINPYPWQTDTSIGDWF